MNPWLVVYVLAGVGAIVLIVVAIARDYLGLWNDWHGWHGWADPDYGRGPVPWFALALAVMVGLFLTAAVLR